MTFKETCCPPMGGQHGQTYNNYTINDTSNDGLQDAKAGQEGSIDMSVPVFLSFIALKQSCTEALSDLGECKYTINVH